MFYNGKEVTASELINIITKKYTTDGSNILNKSVKLSGDTSIDVSITSDKYKGIEIIPTENPDFLILSLIR